MTTFTIESPKAHGAEKNAITTKDAETVGELLRESPCVVLELRLITAIVCDVRGAGVMSRAVHLG